MWPFSSRKPRATNHTHRRRNSFRPCLEVLEDRCLPSGGLLDPTFGTGGIVNTNIDYGAREVAVYSQEGTANDGKIVTARVGDPGTYEVVRYNLNGKLDYSFGVAGEAMTKLGTSGPIYAQAVAVQPDGKVLVGGYPDLVRYTVSGSLDTTFGKNGEVVTPFATRAMTLQPDGKIVIGGTVTNGLILARYNANGSLDTSFGTGGEVTVPFASPFEAPNVALDAETSPLDPNAGKIVVAGELNGKVEVVRFNTNGSLDASFGTGGMSTTVLSVGEPPALAIQSDERIVVAEGITSGGGFSPFGLVRLNPDGTPDPTFGSSGFADPALPSNFSTIRSLAIQSDGKILAAGAGGSANLLLARYNATDGSLDTSFGSNGVAVVQVGPLVTSAGMALEPDGRIVVAGTGGNRNGITTFVVRFLATGPRINSFTASPNPVIAGSNVTLTAANVAALNPGSTVTQVAFYVDTNGDDKLEPGTDTLLGYAVQTSPGTWVLTISTTGWTPGTFTLFAQAKDSDGAWSDSLAATLSLM